MDLRDPAKSEPGSRRVPPAFLALGGLLALLAIAVAVANDHPVSRPARLADPVTPLLAPPAPPPPTHPEARWIEWDASQGLQRFKFDGFAVEITAVVREDLNAAKVIVRADSGVLTELIGDGTPWNAAAKLAVVRLDAAAAPMLLVSSFSGGAHCCTSVTALDLQNGDWRRSDLGAWDGDMIALPTDLDGDGTKEFQFVDQAFLYAFASYADSWAPPVIKRLVDGRVHDVSTQTAFRPVYRRDADRSRAACLAGSNGACAAFVAASARAGQFDAAWAEMLGAYDQASDWTLPTACRVRTAAACPTGAELTFATYPEALQWFLGEQGYTARSYVEPLAAAGPSFSCGAAAKAVERLICADAQLSRLDRTLAVAFARAQALTPDRPGLRTSQRAFLSSRDSAVDPTGLTALYEQRIQQLLAIDETA